MVPGRVAAAAALGFVVISVLHLGAQLGGDAGLSAWTQALLMPLLVAPTCVSYPPGRIRAGVVCALVLSWVGDVLPGLVAPQWSFLVLVGSFFLAQLSYIAVFLPWVRRAWGRPRTRTRLLLAAVAYAVVAIGISALLLPHAGNLAGPVAVYAVVLAAMATCAVTVHPLAAVGGALFVVSDALIAFQQFWPSYQVPGHGAWVMATYISAQALLVLGTGRRLAMHRPGRPVEGADAAH